MFAELPPFTSATTISASEKARSDGTTRTRASSTCGGRDGSSRVSLPKPVVSTLCEAELSWFRQRAQAGLISKAQRGEQDPRPPVRLHRGLDGRIERHLDRRARKASGQFTEHGKNCKEPVAILDRVFAIKPRDEWMRILKNGGDFIHTVVNRVSDLPHSLQVQVNEYVVE